MKLNAILLITLVGCGYSAKDNEMVGQVKKVVKNTPILCSDYTEADISLGVLRNGTGSTSKDDIPLYVEHEADIALLKRAAEDGTPVRITYDVKRLTFCIDPDHWLTSVEELGPKAEAQPKIVLP